MTLTDGRFSTKDNNNNNQNNQNQNQEASELCQQAYQRAAKCETNLKTSNAYYYPDTSGCDYIKNILPRLTKASSSVSSGSRRSSMNGASVAFAIIFFLTSCVLAAYSFFLYRKIHRAKVNLAQSEGMMMA